MNIHVKKTLKYIAVILLAVIVLSTVGFVVYAQHYYHAESIARDILTENNVIAYDDMIILHAEDATTGIIFYPGAKVEYIAYLPLLKKLQDAGITCVAVKMPLNFAFLGIQRADKIYSQLPYIESWYIMGHSLGGAMASVYAEDHRDEVDGLIVLGAYVYGDYPIEKSLTIYGSFNANLEKHIDYDDNIVIIDGGNHAMFGNYGKQKGDPDATISSHQQQTVTVDAITAFLSGLRKK